MIWELFFMLVVLKIPVVYLCAVVWWAIRAQPQPQDGAGRLAPALPRVPGCDWRRRHGPLRGGPHPRGGRAVPHRRVARASGRLAE